MLCLRFFAYVVSPVITLVILFGWFVPVQAQSLYLEQEQTSAAPGGSVAPPLNSSLNAQWKAGALLIGKPTLVDDDFEDGVADGWQPRGNGAWAVIPVGNPSNNVFAQTSNPPGSAQDPAHPNDAWQFGSASAWTNFSIQARVMPTAWTFTAGDTSTYPLLSLYGRWSDHKNWYDLKITNLANNSDVAGASCLNPGACTCTVGDPCIAIKRSVNDVKRAVASAPISPININTWYTLKLDFSGSTIRGYLNNLVTPVITGTDTTYGQGTVSLGMYNASANFDDVVVQSTGTRLCLNATVTGTTLDDRLSDHDCIKSWTDILFNNYAKLSTNDINASTHPNAEYETQNGFLRIKGTHATDTGQAYSLLTRPGGTQSTGLYATDNNVANAYAAAFVGKLDIAAGNSICLNGNPTRNPTSCISSWDQIATTANNRYVRSQVGTTAAAIQYGTISLAGNPNTTTTGVLGSGAIIAGEVAASGFPLNSTCGDGYCSAANLEAAASCHIDCGPTNELTAASFTVTDPGTGGTLHVHGVTQTNSVSNPPVSVLVLRAIGGLPTLILDRPQNGRLYEIGMTIGAATVAYVATNVVPGTTFDFDDTGLSDTTMYYYRAYQSNMFPRYSAIGQTANRQPSSSAMVCGDAICSASESSSGLCPSDCAAISPIKTFTTMTDVNQATFSPRVNFTVQTNSTQLPVGSKVRVLIVRGEGQPPTWRPVTGGIYTAGTTQGDATVIYMSGQVNQNTFLTVPNDTTVVQGHTYYYHVYESNAPVVGTLFRFSSLVEQQVIIGTELFNLSNPGQCGVAGGNSESPWSDLITCGSGSTDCTGLFELGSQVTIDLSVVNIGWQFITWSGAGCTGVDPCTITMDSPKNLKALCVKN